MQAHGILKIHVKKNVVYRFDFQETMQELVLAKEKSASAWNEASKSMYLLDEQSQKIEELSDQMKELKSFYSTSMQQSASLAAPSITCTEPNLPETVRLGSIDFKHKLIF